MLAPVVLIFLIIILKISVSQNITSDILVSSPLGQYRGSLLTTSFFGKTIFSFRGIRYAKPPINELRFKPPVPIRKHRGVYDATKDGPVCPQKTQDPVSEDCLMLNVYTTKLPERSQNPKRPVVIYIHHGNFFNGTSRSNWVGPQYLMNENIVLVTFNYRLGVLGFLSTGDKEAPGNNGFKDQVAAIKWVKNNIEVFGGDSNYITLFGYSAGSVSVSLHLLSPMSKGLFNRAIMCSASVFGQFPIKNDQLDLAKRQAGAVGCPNNSSSKIIECLRKKSAGVLASSVDELFEFEDNPTFLWLPVIENNFGQERFLTEHPIKLMLEGRFQHVPAITGIVAEEFIGKALELSKNEEKLQELDQQWERYAPIVFMYERNTQRSKDISGDLRNFYFGEKNLDSSYVLPIIHIFDDGIIGFGVDRGAKLLALKSSHPVYYYRFSYRGQYSNKKNPYGPMHHEDLVYYFYMPSAFPEFQRRDKDFHIVDMLTKVVANFAKTGNPNQKSGESNIINWTPYNLTTQKFLEVNETVTLQEKLHIQRYEEWEKLFPFSKYLDADNK